MLKMLLFSKLPKDKSGNCVVYDRPIKKFFIGDVTLGAADTPAIIIHGESSPPSDFTQGAQKIEHKIVIKCVIKADDKEEGDRLCNEFVRLIYSILINSRRFWVITRCPFCLTETMSAEHFLGAHSDVLAPYATAVVNQFNDNWNATHTSSPPTPPTSGVSAEAFLQLYEALRADPNVSVTNLTAKARVAILAYIADNVKPIRLMYDAKVSDIKPTDGGREQAGVYTGTLTFTPTELFTVSSFGPDNVDTGAWS